MLSSNKQNFTLFYKQSCANCRCKARFLLFGVFWTMQKSLLHGMTHLLSSWLNFMYERLGLKWSSRYRGKMWLFVQFLIIIFLIYNVIFLLQSGIRSYGDFRIAPNKPGCPPSNEAHLIYTKQRGSGMGVMTPTWYLCSIGMELFITSAARKSSAQKVNTFLAIPLHRKSG